MTKQNQSKARAFQVIKNWFSHIHSGNLVFSTRGSKCFFGFPHNMLFSSFNAYKSSSKAMPVLKWTKVIPLCANGSQAMGLMQGNMPLVKLLVHRGSVYLCIPPWLASLRNFTNERMTRNKVLETSILKGGGFQRDVRTTVR